MRPFRNLGVIALATTVLLIAISISIRAGELPIEDAAQHGMSAERLKRIDEMNRRFTDSGKIPGTLTVVLRNGKIVHQSKAGTRGIEDPRSIQMDDLFRIYSMSKPITATAAMQLYEKGHFQLTDPVSKFVPELKQLQVYKDGERVPVQREMTMQQLLNHTAGFSYGFDPNNPVDQLYREADLWSSTDLEEFIARLAQLPLMFEPGERWHYSVAVDVTGLIVQRLSGQPFDEYLAEHIFQPLDMHDTSFSLPPEKVDRFLPNHIRDPKTGKPVPYASANSSNIGPTALFENCAAMCNYDKVTLFSGGGGLISTLRDYARFAEAMRTGALGEVRILSAKTVQLMRQNHLPASLSSPGTSGEQISLERTQNGTGFGLGFAVVTDTVAQGVIGSNGMYYWGGAAGTVFWIDPVEELVVVSMMQLMNGWPSYRSELRAATYQAIIDSYDDH